MKKFLLILFVAFVATIVMQAQDNANYLAKAFELLLEGNVESAEKHYIVHKKLTGQTDADFEAMLEGEKGKSSDESWKDQCYIVPLNSEYMLAVQKASITEVTKLSQSDAKLAASASRLGGFMDWYLPDVTEMSVLIANLPLNTFPTVWYWTSSKSDGSGRSISRYNKHLSEYPSTLNDYVIVRKFLRNNR